MEHCQSTLHLDTGPNEAPFPYADYVQAKAALSELFRGPRTYVTLTGTSGMGKTSLVRELQAETEGTRNTIIYLSSSRVSAMGIIRCVAQKLHIWPTRNDLETLHLVAAALESHAGHLLLWIDEADQVDRATLQEVRMIAESELSPTPLISVMLCGLPPLTAHLDATALFPLKRRVTLTCVLAGLRRDELEPFLVHRFGTAQSDRLPKAIFDELFERTQATVALIDKVVRRALISQSSQDPIDPEDIRALLDTFRL